MYIQYYRFEPRLTQDAIVLSANLVTAAILEKGTILLNQTNTYNKD